MKNYNMNKKVRTAKVGKEKTTSLTELVQEVPGVQELRDHIEYQTLVNQRNHMLKLDGSLTAIMAAPSIMEQDYTQVSSNDVTRFLRHDLNVLHMVQSTGGNPTPVNNSDKKLSSNNYNMDEVDEVSNR